MTHAEILEMAREIVADPLQKSPHPKATGLASALINAEAKLAAAQAALVVAADRLQKLSDENEMEGGIDVSAWPQHARDALANGTQALDAALAKAREEGHAAGMTEMPADTSDLTSSMSALMERGCRAGTKAKDGEFSCPGCMTPVECLAAASDPHWLDSVYGVLADVPASDFKAPPDPRDARIAALEAEHARVAGLARQAFVDGVLWVTPDSQRRGTEENARTESERRFRDTVSSDTTESWAANAILRAKVERLEREKSALSDCGQHGVCAIAPGCVRHFAERAREILADKDELAANFAAVEAAAARYNKAGDAIDKDKQGQIDRLLSCADMFDDAVKAGDLGSDGSRDAVAMRAGAIALTAGGRCSFCGWVPELPPQKDDSVMQAHIRACEKHPLAAALRERDAYAAAAHEALDEYEDAIPSVPSNGGIYVEKHASRETLARLRALLPPAKESDSLLRAMLPKETT